MTDPTIDTDDLIAWADKAVQDLQEFCDEAQAAAGDPYGDDCLRGTRALIAEYDAIKSGRPTWQSQLAHESADADKTDGSN